MAYFTKRNRLLSKEKWAWSEKAENADIWCSSPGDYRLL
jgi:hypothetical protein